MFGWGKVGLNKMVREGFLAVKSERLEGTIQPRVRMFQV